MMLGATPGVLRWGGGVVTTPLSPPSYSLSSSRPQLSPPSPSLIFPHPPRLLELAYKDLSTKLNTVDQAVFNGLLREKMFEGGVQRVPADRGRAGPLAPSEAGRLVWGHAARVRLGVLPLVQFASGHTFFTQQYFRPAAAVPYLVHATFTTYGSFGKRHRLREHKLFRDAPSYYSEGNFLVYNVTLPEGLGQLADVPRGATPANYFAVAAFQSGLIRSALAVARVLDRTLVLPPLYCSCETFRYDRLEQCIHAGGALILPYLCPVDDVLNLEQVRGGEGGCRQGGPSFSIRAGGAPFSLPLLSPRACVLA